MSDELIEENEFLTPGGTEYITDTTIQIGGPVKRDKLWFFASFQVLSPENEASQLSADAARRATRSPASVLMRASRNLPRFLFKPTLKIGQSDQLTGFFEADSYTVDGRNAGAFHER